MKKKIIFIGGTERSGSTLLDVILSNDSHGMSLGEIQALFEPTRRHHFEKINELKKDELWSQIIEGGKKNLYDNLSYYFPKINFFVDSSKDPFWFEYHEVINKKQFDINHILIYKTPEELANSFIKRGRNSEWTNSYLHYHRKYSGIINSFITIQYKDLITNSFALKKLCDLIHITYFNYKIYYWKKNHATFFGSRSIHKHSEIKHIEIKDKKLINHVKFIVNKNPAIFEVHEFLNERNLLKTKNLTYKNSIGYDKFKLLLLYYKEVLIRKYKFYNPEKYL